jgi:hypothetical protein
VSKTSVLSKLAKIIIDNWNNIMKVFLMCKV